MASPQLEDGRTEVANEILDHLIKVNLSAYDSRVLWYIIRKTYGWHKKEDVISYSQFEMDISLPRRHVARALKRLYERQMINICSQGQKCFYAFQKDFEKWKPLPKEVTSKAPLPNQGTVVSKLLPKEVIAEPLPIQGLTITDSGIKPLPIQGNTKAITKALLQKQDIYIRVFEHWNSLKIIEHKKLTDSMKTKIEYSLKNYSEEDIKLSMSNYSQCRKENPKIYIWTLEEFCQRSIEKFINADIGKQRYEFLKRDNTQKPAHIPGQRVPERYKTPEELLAEN